MHYDRGPLRLLPGVQHDAWGKIGGDSLAARFLGEFEPATPYSELWFGEHHTVPSTIKLGERDIPLQELIDEAGPEVLGPEVYRRFGGRLPFLPKILSARVPLSLQVHPTKEKAEKLHQEDPEHYPDRNHKPEIAVALTELELLCSFAPLERIRERLLVWPEFRALAGEAVEGFLQNPSSAALRTLYTAILNAPENSVRRQAGALVSRLRQQNDPSDDEQLIVRLNEHFPEDVGLLCTPLLNHLRLQAGEAIFFGPNVLHAYIEGDLFECMALSDNVVRAGFTPKYKDAKTLAEIVDVEAKPHLVKPAGARGSLIFRTPAEEFAVEMIEETASRGMQTRGRPEVLLCLSGRAEIRAGGAALPLNTGEAAFVPASVASFTISAASSAVSAARAYVP